MSGIDLDGSVALVTGASRGIGAVIASRLAKAGAKVGVNYRTSREAAEGVVEEITKAGGEAILVEADVTQEDSAAAAIKQVVDRWQRIDILVNNAG
ncbi:MAG: SDR family NAD(P)-dependent oxidoreductase, partial [Chloroflexi bacterium]|nr:SDR family NAD(P)-dependent oxidoreductase [Chloroflexota bacterium]